jgi:hypothetical protein
MDALGSYRSYVRVIYQDKEKPESLAHPSIRTVCRSLQGKGYLPDGPGMYAAQ